ncbi:hypothetical protein ACQEVB_05085 [Pseudonocardia sp. CA-107938]|uniref:hypothetical protein n=1 Tax=Pseudonocardia sp. CA-107938 TaxID=3240021 RepID=UPI003D920285
MIGELGWAGAGRTAPRRERRSAPGARRCSAGWGGPSVVAVIMGRTLLAEIDKRRFAHDRRIPTALQCPQPAVVRAGAEDRGGRRRVVVIKGKRSFAEIN